MSTTTTTRADAAPAGAIVLLGTSDDVLGFALAGVRGVECSTERDVKRALAALDAQPVPPALVLVSAEVSQVAADVIAERSMSISGPVVVVLP